MLRRIPRSIRWAVLVAIIGVVASVFPSWVTGPPAAVFADAALRAGPAPTGPASGRPPIAVRQTRLGDIPSGQQMQLQDWMEEISAQTGPVDFSAVAQPRLSLPPPPTGDGGVGNLTVRGIVVLGLLGTVIGLARMVRDRRRTPTPPPVVVPAPRRAPDQDPRPATVRPELPVTGVTGPPPSPQRR
ncbi:hypothetical protein [Pseudonocardia acidicola]|uniref:Uncharacterized protein n=1 Tax=Pseudonocardia acidicola TaxID=2724939 RepID=A0ABX1SKJ0_9PSEU|nr:hypothetical protein [Pseudonocardia acidicola]NMI00790.1 hypothetical protein [Pseudonocardia acidicola]